MKYSLVHLNLTRCFYGEDRCWACKSEQMGATHPRSGVQYHVTYKICSATNILKNFKNLTFGGGGVAKNCGPPKRNFSENCPKYGLVSEKYFSTISEKGGGGWQPSCQTPVINWHRNIRTVCNLYMQKIYAVFRLDICNYT